MTGRVSSLGEFSDPRWEDIERRVDKAKMFGGRIRSESV